MHDGRPVGFIEVRLRDYAEGVDTSPVGYIEGWYVASRYRRQGIGRMLVQAAEAWAKRRGITEMGSDVRIRNRQSQRVHRRLGYRAIERLVMYYKKLR